MKKLSTRLIPLAAVLCVSLLFSCTSDVDLPPPPVNTSSSSAFVSSSSSVVSSSSIFSSSSSMTSSSSVNGGVSSSSRAISSSSSVIVGTGLCAGFVNGTKREHYGKEKEQFCDPRDGKKYVYVTIDTQTWMAENLNYNTNTTGSKCYNNDETNCDTYGRLYYWETTMAGSASSTANPSGVQGVCPSGWHLPSAAEWNVLMKFVNPSCSDNSTCADAGTKLKATSGWNSNRNKSGNGTDNYGFSALPGGYGSASGSFNIIGDVGTWWSASEYDASYAYFRYMDYSGEGYWDGNNKNDILFSVRCVKD